MIAISWYLFLDDFSNFPGLASLKLYDQENQESLTLSENFESKLFVCNHNPSFHKVNFVLVSVKVGQDRALLNTQIKEHNNTYTSLSVPEEAISIDGSGTCALLVFLIVLVNSAIKLFAVAGTFPRTGNELWPFSDFSVFDCIISVNFSSNRALDFCFSFSSSEDEESFSLFLLCFRLSFLCFLWDLWLFSLSFLSPLEDFLCFLCFLCFFLCSEDERLRFSEGSSSPEDRLKNIFSFCNLLIWLIRELT